MRPQYLLMAVIGLAALSCGQSDPKVSGQATATSREIKPSLTLEGHAAPVKCVAFSEDGKRIVSGSGAGENLVKIWDATTGKEVCSLTGHKAEVLGVAFNHNGERIVSGGGQAGEEGEMKVWEIASRKPIVDMVTLYDVVLSPDAKWRVTSKGDAVKVSDGGKEVLDLTGQTSSPLCVSFSADRKWIVSGGAENSVKVWAVDTSEERRSFVRKERQSLKGHADRVNAVAFGPAPTRVVSGSKDGTVKVWDVVSGKELHSLQHAEVTSVAFSLDGKRIASGGSDHVVKVWDAETGKEIATLKGHSAAVNSVAISPDGTRIVSGSDDKTVKVWDVGGSK